MHTGGTIRRMRFSYTGGAGLVRVNGERIGPADLLRVLITPAGAIVNFQVRGRMVKGATAEHTLLDAATLNWGMPADVAAAGVRFAAFDGPTPIGDVTPVSFAFDASLLAEFDLYYESAANATIDVDTVAS